MVDRDERIRLRARQLWTEDGCPQERSEHYRRLAEAAIAEEEGRESFRPVDAAAAPPQPAETKDTGRFPRSQETGKPPIPHRDDIDPNVVMEGGEYEPISEIETVRRTLEVPPSRRGPGSPPADRQGAMSGLSGSRQR